jgi:2'-5' RNA ligase
MTDEVKPFENDEAVLEVVRRFESCEYAPDDFKHRLHLTVALVYLLDSSYAEALERMRQSLHRFVAHHKLSRVYHETLTVFWMRRVLAYMEQSDRARGLTQLANELNEACANSRLVFDYYTKERLDSDKARAYWLDSDLKPLDF